MKRFAAWLATVAVLAALLWRFPPVHFVPLKKAEAQAAGSFDPDRLAETFWTNRLLPSVDKATDAAVLCASIRMDAAAAKKKFSRSVGMGTDYFYFLRGTGRVVAVDADAVSLAVSPAATNAEIALQAGMVFGDAVRDGTGLLNVNDFPNSQDFNGISSALNHRVETQVLPKLREQAKLGATLSFAGCAEVSDEDSDLRPLKVVPVLVDPGPPQ